MRVALKSLVPPSQAWGSKIRAKRNVAKMLGISDAIEDVLITLTSQYHLIRPLESNPTLFLYVALDRSKANLAMARHELKSFERTLDFA